MGGFVTAQVRRDFASRRQMFFAKRPKYFRERLSADCADGLSLRPAESADTGAIGGFTL